MLSFRTRRLLAFPLVSVALTLTALYGAGCGDDDTGGSSSSSGNVTPGTDGSTSADASSTVDGSKTLPDTGSPVDAGNGDVSTADADAGPVSKFSIGGTVVGLGFGNSVTLQLNGGSNISVDVDGKFTFPSSANIPTGSAYEVTVKTNPPNKTCTVSAGSGTVGTSAVTTVVVNCTTGTFTLGGTISGLASGATVVLTNNGGDDLSLTSNNAFAFATPLLTGAPYLVAVKTQPQSPLQSCGVNKGSGSIPNANVTEVAVTCTTSKLPVKVNLQNLNAGEAAGGTGAVTLRVVGTAGGSPVSLTTAIDKNGIVDLAPVTGLDSGTTYTVTVEGSPGFSPAPPVSAKQNCTITSGGTGTVGATSPEVKVTCVRAASPLGGTVIGLGAGALVKVKLTYRGVDASGQPGSAQSIEQALNANGPFTFTGAALASNLPFTAVVTQQPVSPAQVCTVTSPNNGGGLATGQGDQGNAVSINCTTDRIAVGGQITGLDTGGCSPPSVDPNGAPASDTVTACGVRLKITSSSGATSSTQNFISSGGFQFTRPLLSGESYLVTVDAQPTYSAAQSGSRQHSCTVSAGANGTVGTSATGNLDDITVTCALTNYAVQGDVTGNVAGSGLKLHIAPTTVSAAQDVDLDSGTGTFSFPNIPSGDSYAVSLINLTGGGLTNGAHPLRCTLTNDSGVVENAAPPAVHVTCAEPTRVKPLVQFLAGGTTMVLTLTCSGTGCPGPQTASVSGGPSTLVTAFTKPLPVGATYTITATTPPPPAAGIPQICPTLTGNVPATDLVGTASSDDPSVFPHTLSGPVMRCYVGQSCDALRAAVAGLSDGFYLLDGDGNGPLPAARVYCDYTTDAAPGTSYSYLHVTNGIATVSSFQANSCPAGYELAVPRTHAHLDKMIALFPGSFAFSGADSAAFGIVRTVNTNAHYELCPMSSSTSPAMNCALVGGSTSITAWHPLSGSRWFVRDVADTPEPSGSYDLGAWLGNYTYDSHGVKVDDSGSDYSTGADYICTKSNDKNAN